MTQEEIINQALTNIENLQGIEANWDISRINGLDGSLNLRINNKAFFFNALVKKELRNQTIDKLIKYNEQHKPFIIIATHISKSKNSITTTSYRLFRGEWEYVYQQRQSINLD